MQYTLQNRNGMLLRILPLGGIIQSLTAPDAQGRYEDVVLGFDAAGDYHANHPYFGALIGRYANRIAGGRFEIDGVEYTLAHNDGHNHLHGGKHGFDKATWQVAASDQALQLQYVSPDMEEGYPGELSVTVSYVLTEADELRIGYRAVTTKTTPLNLTSHPYFNLAGQGSIVDHELTIFASHFTPVGEDLVPTGELREVDGSPFDFRQATAIGKRIHDDHVQIEHANGYDHNWVLDRAGDEPGLAARVSEPASGRVLEVLTTEPGLQFYSGNSLSGVRGKSGAIYGPHSGFCLETQHFPDAPNQPGFPCTLLRPGETFESTTIYRFSTMNPG